MTLVEAINEIKKISKTLREENITNEEVISLNQKLHETIDILEIPEPVKVENLIGENNEYIS